MPVFSGQQTTHLQKNSNNASTTPILRTSSNYAPAPASGGSLSEVASLMENRQRYQLSSSKSTAIGYGHSNVNVSRTAAGVLSPRANPSILRSASIDADTILPLTHNVKNESIDQAPQKPKRTSKMRAAIDGTGDLLPVRDTPTSLFRHQQPQRTKRQAPVRSNSSGPSYLPTSRQDIFDGIGSLRRRTANASSDDELDAASGQRLRREYKNSDGSGNDAYFQGRGGGRRQRHNTAMSVGSTGSVGNNGSGSKHLRGGGSILCQHQLIKLSRMKLGHLLQIVIVLAVMALVYESHNKALFATQQLTQFKDEESLLLLHLQKIEQQAIRLHEILGRFALVGLGNGDAVGNIANSAENNDGLVEPGGAKGAYAANAGSSREVDFDLIHKQTQQLYQMEQELSTEVETLQKRIQLSARNHLIQEFGEGPVQVLLDLDFGDSSENTGHIITILLWLDTPHAAWTWLEQIGNQVWDGAEFKWEQGHMIDAFPSKDKIDFQRDGKIEFVERSQHAHQAWTVGVREQPNHADGGGRGSMSMYINLQDNSQLNKHETCVGKVIDGFDALQKLLELSRKNGKDENQDNSSPSIAISIRKATAMHHVTKKAGMG